MVKIKAETHVVSTLYAAILLLVRLRAFKAKKRRYGFIIKLSGQATHRSPGIGRYLIDADDGSAVRGRRPKAGG